MSIQRREELSVFNAVCILAVVLINALSGMETEISSQWGKAVFYIAQNVFAFLCEAFVFLSGLRLLFNRYDKMTIDTFYVNRAVIVILPYTIFACIYYLCIALLRIRAVAAKDFMMFYIKGEMAPGMYFILILVQIYLIMPVLVRLLKSNMSRVTLWSSLGVSLAATVLSVKYPILNRFCPQYLFFFCMGALAGTYYKDFKHFIRTKKALITILFLTSLLVFEGISYFSNAYIFRICLFGYSICAILFLFMIGTTVSDRYYIRNFPIKQVDKSAYFMFLTHGLIISVTDIVLNDKLHMVSSLGKYGIRALIVVVSTFLVSIIWRYIKDVFLLRRDI